MLRRHRSPIQSSALLSTLLLLSIGCGASGTSKSAVTTVDFRAQMAAASSSSSGKLSLRADQDATGESITLSLANASASPYNLDASCTTPTTIWFRSETGTTYFANSGAITACDQSEQAIGAGESAAIATVDTQLVWVDQSEGDRLFRLPRALPVGRYSVHALTSRGEITTSVEVR